MFELWVNRERSTTEENTKPMESPAKDPNSDPMDCPMVEIRNKYGQTRSVGYMTAEMMLSEFHTTNLLYPDEKHWAWFCDPTKGAWGRWYRLDIQLDCNGMILPLDATSQANPFSSVVPLI